MSEREESALLRRGAERRVALWFALALDLCGGEVERALDQGYALALELEPGLERVWGAVRDRVGASWEGRAELDERIQEVSPRWKVGRMASVERSALRLGLVELRQKEKISSKVIGAWANVAREYGEKASPSFVHGLLDQLAKDHGLIVTKK